MTYFALPTATVAFDRARRIMNCGCPEDTPICLGVISFRVVDVIEKEDYDILVKCYCPRCRKRDEVLLYHNMMPYLDEVAFREICNNDLPCGHMRALEVSQWCSIKGTDYRTDVPYTDEYYHILYCRTCRKQTRLMLPRDHAIR